jgi:hypothetical protein
VTTHSIAPDPNTDMGYFNRFVALNVFDSGNRKPFTSSSGAATYESNALTETDLTNLFPSGPFNPAGAQPVVTGKVDGKAKGFYFNFPVLDERTATNSLLLQGCVSWYNLEPGQPCSTNADCSGGTCDTTSRTCIAPQACGAGATTIPARTAFLYQLNAVTGGSDCGLTSSTALRTQAPVNTFILPPPPAQQLISINSKGQIQYSIIAPAGQMSPIPSAATGGLVPFSFSYTIETPRELHQCRHGTGAGPDAKACY